MTIQQDDAGFEGLIGYIQENRGIDFRGYKRTSLHRRITLRMQRVGIDDFGSYHEFLEADPQEFVELLNTVLINVTSFFREPDAWDALKENFLPPLISGERSHRPIRVWSVGCASGEEPYSLAMLLADALGVTDFTRRVKIYATDLDEQALSAARHASFSAQDVEAVPPPMLERFFERTDGQYQVVRDLRKNIIFGRHNIVHDAPISRIDLLVCRNLMIYLETETQDIVLPRLHYALVDNGVLFLGKAETQLARSRLFRPVDLRHRIFQKVPQEWRRLPGGGTVIGSASHIPVPNSPHTRLLDAIVDAESSAYLVVDNDGNLVLANTAARRMLEVGQADVGRPFQDLPVSYRPTELRSHIDEVKRVTRPIRLEHQPYHRRPAEPVRLLIELIPLIGIDGKVFSTLLSFTDTTRTYQLQQELEATQESLETTIEELQSANEELETTNEELQSTNEELETTNEELQSTNEELETTNEELRSSNEELEVINEELRRHSDEAATFRNYAESVIGSLNLGIIVLDEAGCILSWNRWNEKAWGVREEEVLHRPLGSLDLGLPVQTLVPKFEQVVKTGEASELMVDALDRRGRPLRCRVRALPLRYQDRSNHGAVLTLEEATTSD